MSSVTRIGQADVPEVAETLAQAFHDDPIFRWWVPVEQRRKEVVPAFFALIAEAYLPGNEVYRAGDGAAAAVWAPPGGGPTEAELEQLMPRLAEIAAEYTETMLKFFEAMDAAHPTDAHFYLPFVGTRPAFQGRGLGGALLRAVLDGCDRTGTPAYLEATCEDNRRLYERHGFVTTGTLTVRDSPPMFPMWREPREV